MTIFELNFYDQFPLDALPITNLGKISWILVCSCMATFVCITAFLKDLQSMIS